MGVGAQEHVDAAPGRHVVRIGDGHVHPDHVVREGQGGVNACGAGVVSVANADPRQSAFFRFPDGEFGRERHHHLAEAVVSVHKRADGSFALGADVGPQVVAAFADSAAIGREPEDAVAVHPVKVGFDHADGANASVIVQYVVRHEDGVNEILQAFNGIAQFGHRLSSIDRRFQFSQSAPAPCMRTVTDYNVSLISDFLTTR